MERFIQSLSELLEAFPSTTVSLTYSNQAKKRGKEDPKKAQNVVKFKCYEPHLGKVVKYSTHKLKELSRLLIFLGPRGVAPIAPPKRKAEEEAEESSKRQKSEIVGVASVMSNTKYEEVPEPEQAEVKEPVAENETTQQPQASAKSKKKKKGKKK